MYKIGEIAQDVWFTGTSLCSSITTWDQFWLYVKSRKDIYWYQRLVQFVLEKTDRGGKVIWSRSGMFCTVWCRNREKFKSSCGGGTVGCGGGGLLKVSNSPLAPNVFGDFSHYLSEALKSKISEWLNCKAVQIQVGKLQRKKMTRKRLSSSV